MNILITGGNYLGQIYFMCRQTCSVQIHTHCLLVLCISGHFQQFEHVLELLESGGFSEQLMRSSIANANTWLKVAQASLLLYNVVLRTIETRQEQP